MFRGTQVQRRNLRANQNQGALSRRRTRLHFQLLEDRIAPAFLGPQLGVTIPPPVVGPTSQSAPMSAFDAAGNAMLGHKTRFTDDLLTVYQAVKDRTTQSLPAAFPFIVFNTAGTMVGARITATDVNGLLPSLSALGFEVHGSRPDLYFVEGFLPPTSLPALEPLAAYGLMGVVSVIRPQGSAGSITSQADWVHQTERARALNGFDGTGQRIGVISSTFDTNPTAKTHALQDYINGDLSPVQVVREGGPGGNDEGRAMLQIIHDMAPGAGLAVSNAGDFESEFGSAITMLADPGNGNCKTIVDDIFVPGEPMFQHGVIAQAIDTVVAQGVAYFSAAGNHADQSYESTATKWTNDGLITDWYYNFDPAGFATTQSISISTTGFISLVLQWDDPFYTTNGVKSDLDIILRRADSGAIVSSGSSANIVTQTPSERIGYGNTTGQTAFTLEIIKRSGDFPHRVKWVHFGNGSNIGINTFHTHSATVVGHPGDGNAMAVAAAPYYDSLHRESVSSKGPGTTIFTPAGVRYATPFSEGGPRITAVDRANTTFFGNDDDADGFPNFPGTSAAAPAAAAIGALIRQRFPNFTPQQVYSRLQNSATDIDDPGFDDYTGSGLVNAYKAIYSNSPITIAEASFSDGFESGALGRSWEVDNLNAGRVQITNSYGPSSGAYEVLLDNEKGEHGETPSAAFADLILHVNAAGAKNLVLTFDEKRFGVAAQSLYAELSGDGVHYYDIADLSNSSQTWQTYSYDLVAVAASMGLTLSSDTRIKFSEFGKLAAPNGGYALDNISVTRHGTAYGAMINDINGNGSINPGDVGVPGLKSFLDANNNYKLDRGTPNVFNYTGGAQPIPDMFGVTPGKLETTTFVGIPNPAGPIVDLNVTVNIAHGYTGDLQIYLISPGGLITVPLALNAGGQGQDMMNLTFDDESITPIASGFGPFTGTYRPASPLSAFNGMSTTNSFGNWTLRVIDSSIFTAGTLLGWSMSMTTESQSLRLPNLAIPDFVDAFTPGYALDSVLITGLSGLINDVNVNVSLNHSFDGDLRLTLISPNGVRVVLADRIGGGGHNFTNTTFDDSATSYVFSASAPFTGTYRPSEFLFKFNGLTGSSMNGYWSLEITDNASSDVGTLVSWSVQIGVGEEFFTTDPSGNYRFNNQLGEYRLVDVPIPGWRQTNFQFTGFDPLVWLSGTNYANRNYLYVTDTTAPHVSNMTLLSPVSSNLATVNYQVTFSRPVYGLSTDNFQVESTGSLTGTYVSNITGSEDVYILSINTGTGGGTGTVVLDYTDSYGVTDSAYNSIVPGVVQAAQAATIDRTAPTAISNPANVTSFGVTYVFTVTYSDNVSIGVASLDGNDVRITGPGGFNAPASFSMVNLNNNGTPRTATYSITPPGGSWDSTDNGAYSVMLQSNQVTDAAGNPVAAGLLGTFQADLPAPGNFVVLNANDKGTGSLRQALMDANAQPTIDTVSFDPTFFSVPRTITLLSGELPVTESVTIVGPGASLVTVDGNKATRVFNVNVIGTGTAISMSGLTITGGATGSGGGIFNGGEALSVTNCVIMGNSATFFGGGGIYLEGGTVTIEGCTIAGNTGTNGGGIQAHGGGSINVHNSTISGNKSSSGGAGVYSTGNVLIDASTISGNIANAAGGGVNFYSTQPAVTLTVRNSTISGNTAVQAGGGILAAFNGSVVLQNSTITGNSAGGSFGGGGVARVYSSSSISVDSCIIAGNTHATAPDVFTTGTVFANFSAIGSKFGVTTFVGDATTTNLLGANLKLGALANNGGPTLTHLPDADSPLFNKGSNVTVQPNDQRGLPRGAGGKTDIGAVELQATTLIVINANDSGAGSLRAAILSANGNALADTITFDPTFFTSAKTIVLTGGVLSVSAAVAIQGLGANTVIISGNNNSLVFFLDAPGSGAAIDFFGVTITSGKGGNGGGIYNLDEALSLTDCVVTSNSAMSSGGGILVAQSPGSLALTRCTISNNTAAIDGGGILINGSNGTGANLSIYGSTLSGNMAGGHGGGILALQKSSTLILNSTLSGNTAGGSGGGVAVTGVGDALSVLNSTVTNNTATGKGGGIARLNGPDQISIVSSIVSGNNSAVSTDLDSNGGIVYLSYSAVGNSIGFTFAGTDNLPFGASLKLGPLTNNGGSTQTHLPGTYSPLVHAGINTNSLTTDQRGAGYARKVGKGIDIGAVELQDLGPLPTATLQVNNGAVQRSMVTSFLVTFSTPVSFPDGLSAAFTLERTGPTGPTGVIALAFATAGNSVTITFSDPVFAPASGGKSLIDGNYKLTLNATKIENVAGAFDGNGDLMGGDNKEFVAFRLFGDGNGDRTVSSDDFALLRGVFGVAGPAFDFDGNGVVNSDDFAEFRKRFGLTI